MARKHRGRASPRWKIMPLRKLTGDYGTVRYRCPNGHLWVNILHGDPPLVNIKCPTCSVTAVPDKEAGERG